MRKMLLAGTAAVGTAVLGISAGGKPAQAAFVCTTTPTDSTCTNNDTAAGSTNIANQNATTINAGTNSGTILTETTGGGNATLINSGTNTGQLRAGTSNGGNVILINSGTNGGQILVITSNGGDATVTNSGSNGGGITVEALGVGNATVTNSGTNLVGLLVESTNGNATGINTGINIGNFSVVAFGPGNAVAVNSGTIVGAAQIGAIGGGTETFTNSGTISNFGGTAIVFAGSGPDTLNLLAGSKIIGAINLIGTSDTVNFLSGNHNLTFNTLAGATVTSTGLFAVSGNQAASVDGTQFAANGRVLGDFTRSVSQLVPEFGNRPTATGGPIGYAPSSPASVVSSAFDNIPGRDAYAADQAVFKAPTVVQADGSAIWARGFGGNRIQQADGVLLRTSSTFYGGAIGFEKQLRPDLRVGAFVGAGTTRSQVELNTSNTDSTLGFGGIYARYFVGASFLYAAIQGGGSHNDTTRNINNNLLAGGIESATGSYNGWYVSPELKLGHHIALGRVVDSNYTLTPGIGVRYLYGSFGGYTETGSTANLTVNSQTAQSVEERAELKLTRATTFDARNALLLDIYGGALGIQRVGSNIVNAALLGQSIPFATPGKDDVWGGFGGAGMEWRTGNVALFAAGEYLWLSDSSTIVSGKGGVRVAF